MYSCDFAACPTGARRARAWAKNFARGHARGRANVLPASSSRLADVEYVSLSLFLELAAPEDSANGRVRLSSSRFACSLDGYACHGDETTVSICVRT